MRRACRSANLMHQAQSTARPLFSTSQIRSVIVGLMLVILLAAIDQTIISMALPMMSAELHDIHLLAWVVSGYLVAMAVVTPIYGKVGDLYGRRATLSFSIGLFLLASVACAMAASMPMLVAARILQGIGGGGLFAVSQAVIADVVAPRERARYQAYFSATYATASVAGPIVGGLLINYLSWRWVFWINIPIGLAAFVISRRALALLPVPHIKRSIDYIGALLLCAGLAALLIGVTRVGQGQPWLSADNIKLFAAAAVLLAIFLAQQRHTIEPILPLPLLRIPTVMIACAVLFIAFAQVISLSVLIPLRAQMMTGIGTDAVALQLMALTLSAPIAAFVSGKIMTSSGLFKPCLLVGTAIVPVALFGFAVTGPGSIGLGILFIGLTGFGIGLQFSTGLVAVQNAVPQQHVGIATATVAFSRSLGAAIGVAVLTSVLLASLRESLPAAGASLSGADLMKDLIGGALVAAAGAEKDGLQSAVQAAFRQIFTLSAIIAGFSFFLALLFSNDILRDRASAADQPEASV
jgi:EmrB/QacA subfamily drug resistance transporter